MIFVVIVETAGVTQVVCACLSYAEAEQMAARFRARAQQAIEKAVASKAERAAMRIFGDARSRQILSVSVRIEQVPVVDMDSEIEGALQSTLRRAMNLTGIKTSDD